MPRNLSARNVAVVSWIAGALLLSAPIAGQTLTPGALVAALKQGGCVMVVRHASSPRETPSRETASANNVGLERQLDEAGRAGASAMGQALRDLRIPIGSVLTSPAYRAQETVRLAAFANATPVVELGDGGQSMRGVTEAQAAWLRERVTHPTNGTNVILVTHAPNLTQAFPEWGASVTDGEAIVLRPDGKGAVAVVGRVRIEDWPRLVIYARGR